MKTELIKWLQAKRKIGIQNEEEPIYRFSLAELNNLIAEIERSNAALQLVNLRISRWRDGELTAEDAIGRISNDGEIKTAIKYLQRK